MVDQALERYGRIDVLHNNVGADHVGGPVETTEADWERNLKLNVTSRFLRCKHVLAVMADQGSGAIVNTSSIAGDDPGAVWSSLERSSPPGRLGDAWDGAHAAVFLASDEASYINGAALVVDGGLSATVSI